MLIKDLIEELKRLPEDSEVRVRDVSGNLLIATTLTYKTSIYRYVSRISDEIVRSVEIS